VNAAAEDMVVVEAWRRALDPKLDMWAGPMPVVREWIGAAPGP